MRIALLVATLLAPALGPAVVEAAGIPSGYERHEGLMPVYVDRAGGRVLLLLPPAGPDGVMGRYLYQTYLSAGLGSNDVGLDRNKPSPTQLIQFRRMGRRVFASYENTAFVAGSGTAAEQRAVRDSFARSVVWSGEIVTEEKSGVLVDVSGFLTRDVADVAAALKKADQGTYQPEDTLSFADIDAVAAFPDNVELEADETFSTREPGKDVAGIVPDPRHVTVAVHHSFIRLPPPGFTQRAFDPRTGTFDELVADYGAKLTESVVRRLAPRFRLEKTDPSAAISRVKKPIVFYVDRAAPEPVRTALVAGATWWGQAFEAAGYKDAFRVEVLPEGVSTLDARYNVINWVHRQTRGWSYGMPVVDPRTGEIVRGSVLLGSLRVRQDRLIFEGLEGAEKTGTGAADDPVVLSLARLRQLAVHETGHALGFAHNFAASTYGDRESVMDYPPPRVGVQDGRLDFSDAYKVGVGTWDRFAVRWLYGEPPPGADTRAWLDGLARGAADAGLRFVADDDSRPAGSAHPLGNLWDDGGDAVAALERALEVRRIALAGFGVHNLPQGAPLADLKRVLVPVYLFHRYEMVAACKLIGGVDFSYSVAGAPRPEARIVSGAEQRRALKAVLATASPALLDLPDGVLNILDAGQAGSPDKQYQVEVFGDPADPVFDLPDAAQTAAGLTFSTLLAPARLNRVAEQSGRDPGALGVPELLDAALSAVRAPAPAHAAELRRRIQARLVMEMARTQQDAKTAVTVQADIRVALDRLAARKGGDAWDAALAAMLKEPDRKWLKTQEAAPPGMPIGD
jgi:hypothetical protein